MLRLYKILTKYSEKGLSYLLQHRLAKGKEFPNRVQEKKAIITKTRPNGHLIWVHGASIGEAQSSIILIEKLLEKYPQLHILVTTGTITSAEILEKKLPLDRAFHQFYPLDHPKWVERFLKHWSPDAILWMESELWPNMLSSITHKNIPTILVNARMSEGSYKKWKYFPSIIKECLKAFTLILCQTEKGRERFIALGANNVISTGNIKYSAEPLNHDKDALSVLENATAHRNIWLYASTHKGEEEIACNIHQQLKPIFPNLLTIVVPRHPKRKNDILQTCQKYTDLKTEFRSDNIPVPSQHTDIYIADTLGELGLFYKLSPIACIGRSLSDDGGGGHNPIEAAQLGCAVIHGQNIQNLQEIYDDMLAHNASISAKNMTELKDVVNELLSSEEKLKEFQNKALLYSRQKQNIADNVFNHIKIILDKTNIPDKQDSRKIHANQNT